MGYLNEIRQIVALHEDGGFLSQSTRSGLLVLVRGRRDRLNRYRVHWLCFKVLFERESPTPFKEQRTLLRTRYSGITKRRHSTVEIH